MAGGLPRLLTDSSHKFVWGANGLAYNITIGGGAVATYHADQLGSIREITNADGSVRTTYLTDEYGNRTTVKGTDDQPFQYTGEQVDPETGFVFLRARYYDSGTGRFISRDVRSGHAVEPVTLNRFDYVGNNPINRNDPSGHQPDQMDGPTIDLEGIDRTPIDGSCVDTPFGCIWIPFLESGTDDWDTVNEGAAFAIGLELYAESFDLAIAARDRQKAADCNTAIKCLTQYRRLAQEHGVRLSQKRLAELDAKRDAKTIRRSDLPGTLQRIFPGRFDDMTLEDIERECSQP